jgi:hypothetical protein
MYLDIIDQNIDRGYVWEENYHFGLRSQSGCLWDRWLLNYPL